MKRWSGVVFALCVALISLLHAQPADEYQVRFISVQEGLPDRTVYFVSQDREGLIWVITASGLSSYNGYAFTQYGMPGSQPDKLVDIDFDAQNHGYVLDNRGHLYAHQGQLFSQITPVLSPGDSGIIDLVFDDTDHLWITSRVRHDTYRLNHAFEVEQVYPYDAHAPGSKSTRDWLKVSGDRSQIAGYSSAASVIWFGTSNIFPLPPGMTRQIGACWDDGMISVVTNYAVFKCDQNACQKSFGLESGIGQWPVIIDQACRSIWQSGYDNRIFHLDLSTGENDRITLSTHGYPYSLNSDLFEDHMGNIWVSTDIGIQVIYQRPQLFETWDIDGNPEGSVVGSGLRGMLVLGDDVYFSVDMFAFNRLNVVTGEVDQLGGKKAGFLKYPSYFHSIAYRDSVLYTINGLQYDLRTGIVAMTDTFRSETNVCLDTAGHYYSLGALGFRVLDKPGGTLRDQIVNLGFPQNLIPGQGNTVWVSTSAGLFKYAYDNGIVAYYISRGADLPKLEQSPGKIIDGLPTDIVTDVVTLPDHHLWLATGSGLVHVNTENDSLSTFGADHGIPASPIYALLPEGDSALWLGTGNGLCRFDLKTLSGFIYSTDDGIPHQEFNRNARLRTSSGDYYMGGIDGICRFRPEILSAYQERTKKPRLRVESLAVYNYEGINTLRTDSVQARPSLILRPEDRYVEFTMALADYQLPERNQYQFFLEGLEVDWTQLSPQRAVRYSNLAPGRYVFHARALGGSRTWCAEEISIPIEVRQAFYQTFWFPVLVILGITGLILVVMRYRFKQKLKLEQLRNRISSDLHDEVGGTLSGVAMQMDLLRHEVPDHLKHRIQRVARSSRSANAKMRDVIWAIDASRDTFEDLEERMKTVTIELLAPLQIRWEFNTSGLAPDKKIRAVTRQQIYLIFKEAITNISRHAEARFVSISIHAWKKGLALRVADDGKGFEHSAGTQGNGLKNMHKRAAEIRATLTISSDHGTRLELLVPELQ